MKKTLWCTLSIILAACAGAPEPVAQEAPAVLPKEYPVNESFRILADRVTQGTDKEALVLSPTSIKTTYYPGERTWNLRSDISALPTFSSPQMPLLEAVYNLSLEEALRDINNKGLLMAGEKWPGTWTRDISYGIHLALGTILPEASKSSLLFKVNSQDQVIQDTGTGGSWPISTDRVVWAIAAWEIWASTGDREWLEKSYRILKNTAEKDLVSVIDPQSGLYYGESSFMDWREQTYPKWMEPADIYESKALGTNILHQQILSILGKMSKALGKPQAETSGWVEKSSRLSQAINKNLWLENKGYFSVYQYPALMGGMLSDKTETLGNALAVLTGVADPGRSARIMENLPVVPFGPPIIYPQHPHANPYHNKAVWPFVTAYYALAGKKAGNTQAVEFGMKSNLRAAALFITNKENFTYDTGRDNGTAINSNRQLWSVGGQLAGYYRILFGLEPGENGLGISPVVPDFVQGPLSLQNYPYRQAKINITVTGNGSKILSLSVNGKSQTPGWTVPAEASGVYDIQVTLGPGPVSPGINLAELTVAPRDPQRIQTLDSGEGTTWTWAQQPGVNKTVLYRNGKPVAESTGNSVSLPNTLGGIFSLQSEDPKGIPGNFSQPLISQGASRKFTVNAASGIFPPGAVSAADEENPQGGQVVLTKGQGLSLDLTVPKAGRYALRWKYGNNKGPISTDNKCGIRTLSIDGKSLGIQAFPQRGGGEPWGLSTNILVDLGAGSHKVELSFRPENDNMNLDVNEIILDSLEALALP